MVKEEKEILEQILNHQVELVKQVAKTRTELLEEQEELKHRVSKLEKGQERIERDVKGLKKGQEENKTEVARLNRVVIIIEEEHSRKIDVLTDALHIGV